MFTGLRSGERLHENLFHDHEITEPTIREGILLVRSSTQGISLDRVERLAQELATAAGKRDDATVRELLKQVHEIGLPRSAGASAPPGPAAKISASPGATPGAPRNPAQ